MNTRMSRGQLRRALLFSVTTAALCISLLSLSLIALEAEGVSHPVDVAALKSFLSSINDPPKELTNWRGEDPCGDQWEGVFCSPPIAGTSRVVELRLLNCRLSGKIAPQLGNLESLQILDLMWNQLSGSIPKELGNLKELTLMLLNGNNLTGLIPEELGNLHLLNRFQIDSNQISGPIPLTFQNLVSVKHLHMNNNSLTGSIPKELGKLPKLVHLLVDNNKLEGSLPSELANISTLQILQLDNNGFSNATIPQSFGSMLNITKLSMRNCNLHGGLPDFSRLSNLQYLDLSLNQLEGKIPSKFPTELTALDLSSNLLNGSIPDVLGNLSKLQLLSLKDNKLSGPIPPCFGTGAYFTSSNGELILDLQKNSLSSVPTNLTNAVKFRPNLFVWLHGNHAICRTNNTLIHRLCKLHHDISLGESKETDNSYSPSCDPMTCSSGEEPIPAVFYSQGLCRCAMPIVVGYRLKSPSFAFFTPFIKGYEEWIARGLLVSPDQVHLNSFTKESGPRFSTILKIFPTVNGPRIFTETELLRIFAIFSGWKMPPNDFYGPQELLSFNYTLYQDDIHAISSYHQSWKEVLVIVLSSTFGVLAVIATLILLISKHYGFKRKAGKSKASRWQGKNDEIRQILMNVSEVRELRLEEVEMATKSFEEGTLVGQGGYGRVYRGFLSDGQVVAIKRAKEGSRQGHHEFYTEIELLSRLHHRNLVCLLGYCIDQDEQILVYEYMPNGTLKDRLAATENEDGAMDFASRLKVALGAARGIRYLHVEASPPIFHRDIKASNILLDGQDNPRVADFGLSKLAPSLPEFEGLSIHAHVSTVVKGTPGYLDPEYFLTHKLTDKSDVYSFGVVLLELITGMQPIANGKNIVREVKHAYDAGELFNIVDNRMGTYPKEALDPLAMLALRCCDDDPIARPSMNEVVGELERIKRMVPSLDNRTSCHKESFPLSSSFKGNASSKSLESSKSLHDSTDNDATDVFSLDLQPSIAPR
ncbi:hypothetical protein GOP47_0001835 [Adiantum capillus-veneris]|uniref:non-specific serine/threonine protein kinase n=1 Tax=Adiantum capillus-veneris TaxID=13818 RepID=A0A9D4VAU7_ADICA|nr:hypothetical protein GOP47_0001835 [Adiantum capillus-veneris]